MPTFKPAKVVEVLCWGKQVGAVAADPTAGAYVFQYSHGWIERQIQLSPLMMPAVPWVPDTWTFPQLSPATFARLPGLLADALPDSFGNELITAWMVARGINPARITALDRLAYLGSRGMGALEFRPARSGNPRSSRSPLQLGKLTLATQRAVAGTLLDSDSAAESLGLICSVGTSAGGARPKAVVGWNPDTHALIPGQFDLPDGFEHWLLKLDGAVDTGRPGPAKIHGRIEYAYHLMASAAGIAMQPCRLLQEGGRAHFMTRRFDRAGNTKIHMQTLCGLGHYDFNQRQVHAYEQLFLTMKAMGLPDADFTEAFRRMAFNVAARNNDDHTKNTSFILPEGGSWRLSPAYDLTFCHQPGHPAHGHHMMTVNGKTTGIGRADLLAISDRFSIAGAQGALAQVNAALARWEDFAGQAGIDAGAAEQIRAHHLTV